MSDHHPRLSQEEEDLMHSVMGLNEEDVDAFLDSEEAKPVMEFMRVCRDIAFDLGVAMAPDEMKLRMVITPEARGIFTFGVEVGMAGTISALKREGLLPDNIEALLAERAKEREGA